MYGFLIIHVMITLLEFEQALKNFLDLKEREIKSVGTRFLAQAQNVWDLGPVNPV